MPETATPTRSLDGRLHRGHGPWWVECPDYIIRCKTEAAALEEIRTVSAHCRHAHTLSGPPSED